jgi:succinylarginine dihydrolase
MMWLRSPTSASCSPHEQAFADPEALYEAIRSKLPEAEIIVVPASAVSLEEAVRAYLFNAQLVTLPSGGMALIVPGEALESSAVSGWLDALLAGNGPIRDVIPVDVRQSMANGGGPACLRLRVVADPAAIDPRFLLDEARAERIASVIERHWPQRIDPDRARQARSGADCRRRSPRAARRPGSRRARLRVNPS